MLGPCRPFGWDKAALSDYDNRVRFECVGRKIQIARCGAFADATGGIVMRTVARAEPAVPIAKWIAAALSKRNTAKMGADTDLDQSFRPDRAIRIQRRIRQLGRVVGAGLGDLFFGPVIDEHRLAAPADGDPCAGFNAVKIDFDDR